MDINEYIVAYNFDGKVNHVYKKYKYNYEKIIKNILTTLEYTSDGNTLDMDLFMKTMIFVTDTIISSDLSHEDREVFIENLSALNYFDEIDKYLYNDYLTIKQITIHSLGKISIKSNVKYLETAFEKYYNKNPFTCYELLGEIMCLGSRKYEHYCSLLTDNMDLIDSMTLCMHLTFCCNKQELIKAFGSFSSKFNDIFENKVIKADDYSMSYTIMVQNIQNFLRQKDWTRKEYIKSIIYYAKNYKSIFHGSNTDYKQIYSEIMKLKNRL
ncbi:MAG: hypothetical protein LBK13_02815 [Spirochaetales bacterium]|jgi:hypothetical protein|nr:hypothetical protein [Spirochaetales bacterium]